MKKPTLTLGMATFEDFDSTYFTIQALRTMHPECMTDCELVVVDQSDPKSKHHEMLKQFMQKIEGSNQLKRVVLISMPTPTGTAISRQRIFEESQAEAVLCIDSHVIISNLGSLKKLIDWYKEGKDEGDFLQGILLQDDLRSPITHMEPGFRSEMYGTWATLDFSQINNQESVEIEMHGLGMFSSRLSAWNEYGGFNKMMRGFGAEEGYIQEKYRRAGHKTRLLPWFHWVHKFGRPWGIRYPLSQHDKIRNYIIGWKEIEWDLEPIRKHFCEEIDNTITDELWQFLLKNVTNNDPWPVTNKVRNESSCGSKNMPESVTLETRYKAAANTPSDINEHLSTLRNYATKCSTATEFLTKAQASTVALLAGQLDGDTLKKVTTYQQLSECGIKAMRKLSDIPLAHHREDSLQAEIDQTDLLFLDTVHTAEHLIKELERHYQKVNKYIIVHDTVVYGEYGEGGNGPGVLVALREFMRLHPEWVVVQHDVNNNGLTVISKLPEHKKPLPSKIKMAGNFAKAVANHVKTGAKGADPDVMRKRLEICSLCEHRNDTQCSLCGCVLDKKASWEESICPIGKWVAAEPKDD